MKRRSIAWRWPAQHVAATLSILALFGATRAAAAEQPAPAAAWQTGTAFGKQLLQPVSLTWVKAPLDPSLQHLAESTRVAILLDRRVDPSRPIQLAVDQLPLRQVMEQIAQQLELGETTLDWVVYIGPTATARQLRTLSSMQHAVVNRLPAARKRALLERRRWSWERGATPQSLIADLERESGVKIVGQERVPHDQLRAADLPALHWIDRLLLLAAEFNLRFELAPDGAEVRLLPMLDAATISRAYPAKGVAKEVAEKWRGLAPEAEIKVEGDQVLVTGRVEDHERIGHGAHMPGASDAGEAATASATPGGGAKEATGNRPSAADRSGKRASEKTASAGKQVYQLAVDKAPLRQLFKQLGEKLDLDFEFDETAIQAAGHSLDELVSFKVKDASLDELLKAATSPAGLICQRQGRQVKVVPAAK